MTLDAEREHEARRQQLLLRALWRQLPDASLGGWLRDSPPRQSRALAAYRSNGAALAARALGAAFPTVAQMVGGDSFDALAAAFWQHAPPTCGDLAAYGAGLPDFVAADGQLADVPWLADCARLDWAVHAAQSAADAEPVPRGLDLLGSDDAPALQIVLQPGTSLVVSCWPIVQIWHAHRSDGPDRFDSVRAALAAQAGECALVWRAGWRPQVKTLHAKDAGFTGALLEGRSLAAALDRAGADFHFESWLLDALREGRLAAVRTHGADPPCGDSR
jgi:hypothetical protein